ncbi:MAG TPA: hypothetical protein VN604_03090 [Nitrospirota bacterium]|nr:hypothetical protein [Nitrospirota bacterium]
MGTFHSYEQKRELVNILLDSVYYLDLGLAERNTLVCFLMDSFFCSDVERKAA